MSSTDNSSRWRDGSVTTAVKPVREFIYHLAIALTALTLLALTVWICRTWMLQSARYLDPSHSAPSQEDRR
jgi:hypothetical protein